MKIAFGEALPILLRSPETASAARPSSSFGQALDSALSGLRQSQENFHRSAADFAAGRPVEIHQVLLAAEQAKLQLLLAVETGKLTINQVAEIIEAHLSDLRPFGQIAVERGFLTLEDLNYLLGLQAERAKPLSEILVEMGVISLEDLERELQMARYTIATPVAPALTS